jgi:hypothetical protein
VERAGALGCFVRQSNALRYHRQMPKIRAAIRFALAVGLAACGSSSADLPSSPAPAVASFDAGEGWIGEPALTPASSSPELRAAPPLAAPPAATGKDFAEEARLLFRVAACAGDAPLPANLDAAVIKAHCAEILPKIEAYRTRYVGVVKPFLAALEPPGLPTTVVYPFGGGDLVTALTAYPEAREITTISLELPGDPRRIRAMSREALERSLAQLRRELGELLFVDDYSRSETLKKTQRGDIPGELCFFLTALAIHGYEPVSLRYFTLQPDGAIHYLGEEEIESAERTLAVQRKGTWTPPDFSESFANTELTFRRKGDPEGAPLRVHRHLAVNLSDEFLDKNPALLRHLEAKGRVSAMTKAASYLLWKDGFSRIRGYLLGHLDFMVSDSTGIPPRFAASAGLVQETYGTFKSSLLNASRVDNLAFNTLWKKQPRRLLPFRFGYLDSAKAVHLLVTRLPATNASAGASDAGASDAGASDAGVSDAGKDGAPGGSQ